MLINNADANTMVSSAAHGIDGGSFLYRYVFNDPVNQVDPSGNSPVSPEQAIGPLPTNQQIEADLLNYVGDKSFSVNEDHYVDATLKRLLHNDAWHTSEPGRFLSYIQDQRAFYGNRPPAGSESSRIYAADIQNAIRRYHEQTRDQDPYLRKVDNVPWDDASARSALKALNLPSSGVEEWMDDPRLGGLIGYFLNIDASGDPISLLRTIEDLRAAYHTGAQGPPTILVQDDINNVIRRHDDVYGGDRTAKQKRVESYVSTFGQGLFLMWLALAASSRTSATGQQGTGAKAAPSAAKMDEPSGKPVRSQAAVSASELEEQLDAAYSRGKALRAKLESSTASSKPIPKLPGTQMVNLDDLVPMPGGRQFADPIKMTRLGPFDWAKYTPIEVIRHNGVLYVQGGMTRIAVAKAAGIRQLPAYVRER